MGERRSTERGEELLRRAQGRDDEGQQAARTPEEPPSGRAASEDSVYGYRTAGTPERPATAPGEPRREEAAARAAQQAAGPDPRTVTPPGTPPGPVTGSVTDPHHDPEAGAGAGGTAARDTTARDTAAQGGAPSTDGRDSTGDRGDIADRGGLSKDRTETDRTETGRTETGRTGTGDRIGTGHRADTADDRTTGTGIGVTGSTSTGRTADDRTGTDRTTADRTGTGTGGTAAAAAGAAAATAASGRTDRPRHAAGGTGTAGAAAEEDHLLRSDAAEDLQARWREIMVGFVDGPKHAVEEADQLLDKVAAMITEGIEERRRTLRGGWQGQGEGETEELRLALQKYRGLVTHLLQT
ncbi:hypothetical protein LO771_09005 [Streptacidiphilus sp. ASG 303]|uniref:hypothetical protein n=1 Tax=Streptacidiphilus sp. ASG 303 TaxID=2896847 RepID=UPI001E3721B6|nr:hypothetical protein [Streptacidiphilus sp. ASG 303]MCD0482536.1 hypothetical protein [Streptacidiphilus sp. ASG 303]